jgi:hypothetical protein
MTVSITAASLGFGHSKSQNSLNLLVEDPAGWSKARWGNTDLEIIKAFGGEVVRFNHPDEVNHARVGIRSMDLAGTQFRVYMVPGPDDHLQTVLISPCHHADNTDAVFYKLSGLLVEKYGMPRETTEDGTTLLQWTFRTTIITLVRMRVPSTGFQIVHLQYRHKSTSTLGKL